MFQELNYITFLCSMSFDAFSSNFAQVDVSGSGVNAKLVRGFYLHCDCINFLLRFEIYEDYENNKKLQSSKCFVIRLLAQS